jgi:penicillin-binding protein 1A
MLDRLFLEVIAEGEIPQHLEEGVVARGVADIVQVVVLAAGAHALLRGRGRRVNRAASPAPVKTFLNCTMPALVNIRVGSLRGTSGLEATTSWPFLTLVLLSSDGRPLARMGSYKEAPVDAATLPDPVRLAFVSIEDRRFYQHFGLDPRALGRALVTDLKHRRYVQGGSTITQQLAKNSFLDSRRSLRRKAQEVMIALWLELRLSKNEILSRYLSSVYFGDGTYGLRAAARHYFAKSPEQLDVGEAAMLAGLVNAPSRLAPTKNLKGARERARVVILTMVQTGALTAAQAAAVRPATPTLGRAPLSGGGYFTDWAAAEARDKLDAGYGEARVLTTLDRGLQRQAERVVTQILNGKGARQGATQAALIAMRRDGRVVAMVGGRSYADSRFNRATQAMRQPGSAFKPFVYLAALRSGMTPDSLVEDTPLTIGAWSPANYEDRYRGSITLRDAFAHSSNVAAVRLSEKVGRGAVIRAARDLGLDTPLDARPSLPLGAQETTLVELTSAYASIAAGLRPIHAQALGGPQSGLRRLNAKREREPLLDLMRASVRQGTGRAASLRGMKVYGKTGTTSDYRDAVFVGFAGDLVVGVWVGNDDQFSRPWPRRWLS